jgi:colicin import membrane protein
VLAAGAGAVVGSGAGLADGAGLAVPEPAPVAVAPAGELRAVEVTGDVAELTVEAAADGAELTVEVIGDAAEPAAEVTGDAAELTVEATGDAAEVAVEVAVEAVEVCVDVRGGSAAVDACAGRENISMIVKIPAAASAACTATRAMRRAIGCSISSSHSTRNQAAHLPPAAATNLACLDLLFGHHRTVSCPIGQAQPIGQG